MKNIIKKRIGAICLLATLTSCATKLSYNNDIETAKYSSSNIEASIAYPDRKYDCTLDPIFKNSLSCNHFVLTINNKTKENYFIDWNNTYFLNNKQVRGGFYFEGIIIKDRNQSKPNELILPDSASIKRIYPNVLTDYNSYTLKWDQKGFSLGNNGIYLVLKDNKNEKEEIRMSIPLRDSK